MSKADREFIVDYPYGDSNWSFYVFADDFADAENRLAAIRHRGIVKGEVKARIRVGNGIGGLIARFLKWRRGND